jgi:hypothetical protein
MWQEVSLHVSEHVNSLKEIENHFTGTQEQIIKSLSLVSASISSAGAIFIVTSYILFPSLRSFGFQLILMLVIADFVRTFSYFLIVNYQGAYGQAPAVLVTFGELASVFWVSSIAFVIRNNIYLRHDSLSNGRSHRWRYHAFCWGSSLFLTALPFSTGDHECSGALWCWISFDTTMGAVWAVACYFVPVLLVLIYLIYVYYKSWRSLKFQQAFQASYRENLDKKSPGSIRYHLIQRPRIYIYPAIFFLCITCSALDRILKLTLNTRYFFLVLFALGAINLQGFLNAITYVCTPAVRSEWSGLLCITKNEVANDYHRLEEDRDDAHLTGIGDGSGDRHNRAATVTDSYLVASSMCSEEYRMGCENSSAV